MKKVIINLSISIFMLSLCIISLSIQNILNKDKIKILEQKLNNVIFNQEYSDFIYNDYLSQY